jgi:glucose-1-phosphate thymidylyltransferase
MLAGITDILIITTPEDQDSFKRLLGTGEELGISLSYVVQPSPDGLAQAFTLGEDFIGDDNVCLVLGDNIYYGHDLRKMLTNAAKNTQLDNSATVFGYHVYDPERYGVVEFDKENNVISLEEKPLKPKSNYAVTGLYFYPNDVIRKAKEIKPSDRGELEITSINQLYLGEGRLKVELMGRGFAWLDTGTHDSLLEASAFIETIEKRQGLKVACLEEISYEQRYITRDQLIKLAEPLKKNQYGQYLLRRAKEGCV